MRGRRKAPDLSTSCCGIPARFQTHSRRNDPGDAFQKLSPCRGRNHEHRLPVVGCSNPRDPEKGWQQLTHRNRASLFEETESLYGDVTSRVKGEREVKGSEKWRSGAETVRIYRKDHLAAYPRGAPSPRAHLTEIESRKGAPGGAPFRVSDGSRKL